MLRALRLSTHSRSNVSRPLPYTESKQQYLCTIWACTVGTTMAMDHDKPIGSHPSPGTPPPPRRSRLLASLPAVILLGVSYSYWSLMVIGVHSSAVPISCLDLMVSGVFVCSCSDGVIMGNLNLRLEKLRFVSGELPAAQLLDVETKAPPETSDAMSTLGHRSWSSNGRSWIGHDMSHLEAANCSGAAE